MSGELVEWWATFDPNPKEGYAKWIISLKYRKFLKPHWEQPPMYDYYLLLSPGQLYLEVDCSWDEDDVPPYLIILKLIQFQDGKWQEIKRVVFKTFEDGKPILDDHPAKKLLMTILKRIPTKTRPLDISSGPAPLPEDINNLFIPI